MDVKVEYPRWKYHAENGGVIVHDAAEESALGLGWHDCPAKARECARPSVVRPIKPSAVEPQAEPKKIIRKGKA